MSEPFECWVLNPNHRRGEWTIFVLDEANGQKFNQNRLKVIDKAAYDKLKADNDTLIGICKRWEDKAITFLQQSAKAEKLHEENERLKRELKLYKPPSGSLGSAYAGPKVAGRAYGNKSIPAKPSEAHPSQTDSPSKSECSSSGDGQEPSAQS